MTMSARDQAVAVSLVSCAFRIQPALFLGVFSLVFGSVIIVLTPPLRGPDETAHFLRAYGISQGDFIPSVTDNFGRKGILLPALFHRDFSLFDRWQDAGRGEGVPFAAAIEAFRKLPNELATIEAEPVFVPYGGAEGYSPMAYLPQAAAALLARAAGFGFLTTLYLMRLAGLTFMTGVAAYAVSRTPTLKWPFAAIALLPAVLYARAVINADSAAFAFSLIIVAAFLRALCGLHGGTAAMRTGWLVLCALSKPPNVAFILLEWFRPSRSVAWKAAAAITFPAVAAALLWSVASSADVAAWRLVELTGTAAREFTPAWKLQFMFANPQAFPSAVAGTMRNMDLGEFLRQLIGVLGLFDAPLRSSIYIVIGLFLAATFATPLHCGVARFSCLVAVGFTALVYCFAVLLIFYVVWTPIGADQVWGVQGRYFVPVLPLTAVLISACVRCSVENSSIGPIAIACAATSALGSIDAILRSDWRL